MLALLTYGFSLCPQYIDKNTSSTVNTYQLGSTVLMTRSTDCIDPLMNTSEFAEGSWRVGTGTLSRRFLNNTYTTILTADYGFHEVGVVHSNSILWTNGAKWYTPEPHQMYTVGSDILFLKRITTNSWGVLNSSSVIQGVMIRLHCNDVFLNGKKGRMKGGFIIWDNFHIWTPLFVAPSDTAQP